jgi:hypothetical protein
MNQNGTGMFDPFSRHRSKTESQPKPDQIDHRTAEATAVDQPAKSKPVVEEKPSPAARAGKAVNPFAQHAGEKKIRPKPARSQEPPAQRLMAWLPRWPKATISVRDVRLYGPNSLRDPEIAADAIEVLAGYGWLVPVMTRQHNMNWWQIVRGRDPAVASRGVAEP